MLIFVSGCAPDSRPYYLQRAQHREEDLTVVEAQDPLPISQKLTLEEIIEIALENNYDLRAKKKEYDIQYQFAIRDDLKILPQVFLNGENSERNNPFIVSSTSVDPGVPPAPPSISMQRHINRHDITVVLNLLDFGLAYFKARQEERKAYVALLEIEKTKQSLILDIHKQFWRAVAAKVAMDESARLIREAQKFQEKISDQISDKIVSRPRGLKSRADLQNIQLAYIGFDNEYYKAMGDLAVFMGLLPSSCFELEYEDQRTLPGELEEICTLENRALMLRPELYVKDAEEGIADEEIRYAFLQLLPGIELFAGNYFDANKYFTNNNWIVAGARATWNLLNLPSQGFDVKGHRQRKEWIKTERMALSISILSQVRLAYILYQENYDQYKYIHSLEETNKEFLLSTEQDVVQGVATPYELLTAASQALLSKVNAIRAYGDVQLALAQLRYSTGALD